MESTEIQEGSQTSSLLRSRKGSIAMERSEDSRVIAVVSASRALRERLEGNGWAIEQLPSLEAGRHFLQYAEWDLALISDELPDGDGLTLCAEARISAPHRYLMLVADDERDSRLVKGFAAGADDCVSASCGDEELLARVRAGLRVASIQKFLLRMNVQLEEISLTDDLTQLRNRRAFDRELESRFEVAKRYERALSLAVIDVDHFKNVNDRLGHEAGDMVLRAASDILARSTRRSDCVARIGGDEFAVILPETSLRDAMLFGDKIRAAVGAAIIQIGGHQSCVTISVGVASLPHSLFEIATEMLFAADQALYRAKRNGRDRAESENRRERDRFARWTEPPAEASPSPQLMISH